MPLKRASEKDLRQSKKKHLKNLERKDAVKDAVKKFKKALESKDNATAKESLSNVYKTLDKAARAKTIHPNKAARRKSRLTKLLNKTIPPSTSPATAQ
jgi:small subunit ribosomal protein S20